MRIEAENSVHNVVEWEHKKKNGELTFFQLICGSQPLSHNSYSFICHYLGIPEERNDVTAGIHKQQHKQSTKQCTYDLFSSLLINAL